MGAWVQAALLSRPSSRGTETRSVELRHQLALDTNMYRPCSFLTHTLFISLGRAHAFSFCHGYVDRYEWRVGARVSDESVSVPHQLKAETVGILQKKSARTVLLKCTNRPSSGTVLDNDPSTTPFRTDRRTRKRACNRPWHHRLKDRD